MDDFLRKFFLDVYRWKQAHPHETDYCRSGFTLSIGKKYRRLAINRIIGFIGFLSAISKFFRHKFEKNASLSRISCRLYLHI
jgi:hypothetical protein